MRKILCLFVASLSVLCTAQSDVLAQNKAEKMIQLLTKYNDYGQFNGTALVAENGKVICKKAFGLANLEWRIPNTIDTKFRIGSVTKSFTAILILQLVQQGKLKLEDRVTEYLSDFPKEKFEKITVNHLLTHTS